MFSSPAAVEDDALYVIAGLVPAMTERRGAAFYAIEITGTKLVMTERAYPA